MSARMGFQEELAAIHRDMIRLGSMVEEAIHKAIQALADRNAVLAHEVIAGDDAIDALEREITRSCVSAIARQQPVARDLRNIASNMKLVTDLERIADHAEDVSRHALSIMDSGIDVEMPSDLLIMSEVVNHMLHEALDAYVSRDLATAYHVIRIRDRVARVGATLYNELVEAMQKTPSAIPALVELVLIVNHMQRAAGHTQNVAEWIVYYLRGTYVEDDEEPEANDPA
ncbi:MAG: phosphate signaling complex protein PhoU [Saccharofermentanales bacterium]|jgi:phosphate transport system protein